MFKAIYLKFGRDKRDLTFCDYSNSLHMKIKDKNLGSCFLEINITTHGGILGGIFNIYGKKIILNNNGNLFTIGALNSNKKLKNDIEAQKKKKIKKIIYRWKRS